MHDTTITDKKQEDVGADCSLKDSDYPDGHFLLILEQRFSKWEAGLQNTKGQRMEVISYKKEIK